MSETRITQIIQEFEADRLSNGHGVAVRNLAVALERVGEFVGYCLAEAVADRHALVLPVVEPFRVAWSPRDDVCPPSFKTVRLERATWFDGGYSRIWRCDDDLAGASHVIRAGETSRTWLADQLDFIEAMLRLQAMLGFVRFDTARAVRH